MTSLIGWCDLSIKLFFEFFSSIIEFNPSDTGYHNRNLPSETKLNQLKTKGNSACTILKLELFLSIN